MQTEALIETEPMNRRLQAASQAVADGRASDSLFPVATLPSQFADLTRRTNYPDGERRLMVAVLDVAVRDYLANAHPRTAEQRMRFAEVNYWINQKISKPGLFSFQWLCDALEIDGGRLRRRLDTLRRRAMCSRISSIGAASGHYRSVRKITPRPSSSRSSRAHGGRSC